MLGDEIGSRYLVSHHAPGLVLPMTLMHHGQSSSSILCGGDHRDRCRLTRTSMYRRGLHEVHAWPR